MIVKTTRALWFVCIALTLFAGCAPVDAPVVKAPQTAAEIEGIAELFRGLAEGAAESGETAKAGALFVVSAMFLKDVQKALWREAVAAEERGDPTGFAQAMAAAGRAARRAADTMNDAARAFEQAGQLEDAWRTHFEAARCYRAAASDFLLADDTESQQALQRDAANAHAQGAAIQGRITGNP